ncbi:MAG: YhdH/YhfP family quinone oxidoreductase, partial [Marinobacter sp.]|nr:YhdH/YhfP family quinone oxidoreductase [Marinobacter sp.]
MTTTEFKAWRVQEQDGEYVGSEQTLSTGDLPANEVLIRVSHSSLNYKDALSASGNKGVTRNFPHTPGIDAAGKVIESATGEPSVGSQVIVTGYDLGMNTDGGFGEYIRVPASWCVALPKGWDSRTAMIYGTAGLTAGLCVQKLLKMGATPEQGKVAVSGASGAVGSVAVELLSALGFEVVAISGKQDHADELKTLGASEVIGRDALAAEKKPMLKPVFANAVDTVGGQPLAELLKQIQPGGSVSCCGLVAGPQLETTVLPFILRGVNLLGVDSVEIPLADKASVWRKFAGDWA